MTENEKKLKSKGCPPPNNPSTGLEPVPIERPQGKCPMKIIMEGDNVKSAAYKAPYDSMDRPFTSIVKDLTGTADEDIAHELFERAALALPKDKSHVSKFNTILQALADGCPKDSIEAKLTLQSTALYSQGMNYLCRAEHSQNLEYSDFYLKSAIKLLRLHNETLEALCKYRRGGEQRVVVQHVQVNQGGQAIVGSVLNNTGGLNKKTDEVTP